MLYAQRWLGMLPATEVAGYVIPTTEATGYVIPTTKVVGYVIPTTGGTTEVAGPGSKFLACVWVSINK